MAGDASEAMAPPPLCLDHLTLRELTALELIEVAGALGCSAVSLFVQPLPIGPYADLLEDRAALRAVRAALDRSGLAVGIVEPFMLTPETDWALLERTAELTAQLGGTINALAMDDEPARLRDSMGRLATIAAGAGVRMAIEGYSQARIRTPGDAWAMAQACGDHVGITVDTLHLFRTGGSWADLAALPAERIFHVQLADAPRDAPADLGDEAISYRLPPGLGELGFAEFVRDHCPRLVAAGARIAVEAPFVAPEGANGLEKGRIAVNAARALFAHT